jgi:hypothetical protein
LKINNKKKNSKNILEFACWFKKDAYFCTRFENESGIKKEEYVHRHIELTAVSLTRRDKKKESK